MYLISWGELDSATVETLTVDEMNKSIQSSTDAWKAAQEKLEKFVEERERNPCSDPVEAGALKENKEKLAVLQNAEHYYLFVSNRPLKEDVHLPDKCLVFHSKNLHRLVSPSLMELAALSRQDEVQVSVAINSARSDDLINHLPGTKTQMLTLMAVLPALTNILLLFKFLYVILTPQVRERSEEY